MRHILSSTLEKLADHRWTILSAEDDLPWFTTDDPVVKLNFRNQFDYDFNGGWGIPKTNIFMPLSPKHLLFTEVGRKTYERDSVLPRDKATLLRKIIAEHAHRYIFSSRQDPEIQRYRPRVVDVQAYQDEATQWRNWHSEQSMVERQLFSDV